MTVPPRPKRSSRIWLVFGAVAAILATACLLAILFRTTIATVVLRRTLMAQGMQSDIVFDSMGFSGATAHGSLSRPGLQVSFAHAVARFDPQHWPPRVTSLEVVRPDITVDLRHAGSGQGQAGSLGSMAIDVAQAKVVARTGAGNIEVVGDARISGGRPQSVDLVLLPARLHSGAAWLDVKSGRLSGVAGPHGMHVQLAVSGNATLGRQLRSLPVACRLDIPALSWDDKLAAAARSAALVLTMARPAPVSVEARLSDVHVDASKGKASGEIDANAKGSLPADITRPLLGNLPLLAGDLHAMQMFQTALQSLTAHARLSWRTAGGRQQYRLLEPAELNGRDALTLRVAPGVLDVRGSVISGAVAMSLSAPGVSRLDVTAESLTAQPGALNATLAVKGWLSLGPLRDAEIEAHATALSRGGVLEAALQRCATFRLGRYMAKRGATISNVTGTLCPGDRPLLSVSSAGWMLHGSAKIASAVLPSSGLRISRGDAQFTLSGASATPRDGVIRLAATISDAGKAKRFATEQVTGTVTIAGATAHASLALAAGPHATRIGTISAIHHLDSGAGTAGIVFPRMVFSPSGLQPAQISPLFATLAQADGTASFSGRVSWNAKHITSGGRLDIDSVRFSSPLGVAQKLSTHMVFTSLVPVETAPNQRVAIERVDWVQPLTGSSTQVTLSPTQLLVSDTRTDLAGGEISVTPLDLSLRSGATIHGVAQISHLALGKLIAASNLGEKLKLEGSVSGNLPFTYGPDGLRFANGRIEADGPGRLSISRTVWGKGETNSVEKAAYQALENLSYQSLSATVDSVPGGRLRTVFHVVGYDDGPGTARAEFSLSDLVTGKAFQKQIPIPRGTAINLTLDTSLNFDELLRGYQSTWSQMKAMNGASP